MIVGTSYNRRAIARLAAPGGTQVGVALGVMLTSFVVYLITLAPTVYWGDSAELTTAAYHLGIPHPPGYPLYTLLAKLFTVSVPFGDVAYRVNLMSAVFASLAMGTLYLLAFGMVRRVAPALLATMAIAFSTDVWSSAVVAEVYSLQVFLMLASMLAIIGWRRGNDVRWLYALAAIVGLSLVHHRMTILLLPGLAFGVAALGPWRSIRVRQVAIMGALTASGLLFYLYLPLRYIQEPALDLARLSGADLTDPSGFLEFLSARIFQARLGLTSPSDFWEQLSSIVSSMAFHLLIVGVVLAFVGALRQYKRSGREFLFVALVFLPNLLFLSAYRVDDISQFVVIALVPLGLWLAEGFDFVLRLLQRWMETLSLREVSLPRGLRPVHLHSVAPALLLALVPMAMVVLNYSEMDLSDDRAASRYGRDNLEALPQGAVLWTQWPTNVFWYSQMVEGIRPDVEVVDFRYEIHRAVGFYDPRELEGEQGLSSNAGVALKALGKYSDRPLYLTRYMPLLATRWSMEPYQDVYRLTDKGLPGVRELAVGEQEAKYPVFGNALRLVNVALEPDAVVPGGFVRVDLSWRVLETPQTINDDVFVLKDSQGRAVQYFAVEQGHGLMPSREWPQGAVVSEYYDLLVPYYVAPGRYFLELAVGDGSALTQAIAGTSGESFQWLVLGELDVTGGVAPGG